MTQPNSNEKKPSAEELLSRVQGRSAKDAKKTKEGEQSSESVVGEELRPKRPDELETPNIDVHGNAR